MSKLHVAASPLTGRVFCGTVLKSGDTWGRTSPLTSTVTHNMTTDTLAAPEQQTMEL